MIYHTIQHDIALWEAWIEFDQSPGSFGTLYIHGDVSVDRHHLHPPVSKSSDPLHPGKLVLRIDSGEPRKGSRSAEVVYSEVISGIDQYTSIIIFSGDELIGEIDEIEIVI